MEDDPRKLKHRKIRALTISEDLENDLVEFFLAARTGDGKTINRILKSGISPNIVEPSTGFSLLHYIAARGNGVPLSTFLNRYEFNFLVRDHLGRLPSELAATVSEDFVLSDRLRSLELAQADKLGIKLAYRSH